MYHKSEVYIKHHPNTILKNIMVFSTLVVQTLDIAIQGINHTPANENQAIHWAAIYLVDSIIHLFNDWTLDHNICHVLLWPGQQYLSHTVVAWTTIFVTYCCSTCWGIHTQFQTMEDSTVGKDRK